MEKLNKFLNNKSKKYITKNNLYFIKEYKKDNKKQNKNIKAEILCKNIKHDNLMSFIYHVETNLFDYICFKYYPFSDLITYYENNLGEALNNIYDNSKIILRQLVDVVLFLHNNNIAHLDIKLDNILYDKININIILCDFEYCTKINEDGKSLDILDDVKGTKNYISPDWFNYKIKDIDFRKIDTWNIGVVAYLILTKGNTNNISLFKDIDKIIIENNLKTSNVKNDEKELIYKLLKYNPLDRINLNKVKKLKFFENKVIE